MAESRNRVALYAAVGPELTHYAVDVEGAALERRGTVMAPANIHYAWPHASSRHLYVASSDSASGAGGFTGTKHHVTAWHIDPETGARRLAVEFPQDFVAMFRAAWTQDGKSVIVNRRERVSHIALLENFWAP